MVGRWTSFSGWPICRSELLVSGSVIVWYLHLLTGHNFSLNRKISLFWFCQEFPPTGCFSFFRRKLLHVFLWMRTIVGRKDTVNGQKYPANGRKWPKSLLGRHCIKNQPRAEKNASRKKNTFGQLFCLKPFGLKLKPSRRSRHYLKYIYICVIFLGKHTQWQETVRNCKGSVELKNMIW